MTVWSTPFTSTGVESLVSLWLIVMSSVTMSLISQGIGEILNVSSRRSMIVPIRQKNNSKPQRALKERKIIELYVH